MEEQEYIIGMCGGQPIFGYPTDASEDTVSYSYNNIKDEPVLVPTQKLSKVLSTLHTLIAKLGKPFSGSYNDLTDKPTLFSGSYNDLSNKPTIPSTKADIGLSNVDNTADANKSVNYAKSAGSSGSCSGNSSTSTSVLDYGNTSATIKIGWNGAGLSTTSHVAAYGEVSGQRVIKDISLANLKTAMALNNVNNTADGNKSVNYANRSGLVQGSSDTFVQTSSGTRLAVQVDGNMVLYHNWNKAVWSTGTSSLRFKKNVNDITEERARKILDIRVRTFDYKENQVCATGLYDKVGVIAEEVSPIMRDVVIFDKVDDSGNVRETEYNVDYQGFVPYLIKMVQMQQDEINDLKHRIDLLEKRN